MPPWYVVEKLIERVTSGICGSIEGGSKIQAKATIDQGVMQREGLVRVAQALDNVAMAITYLANRR